MEEIQFNVKKDQSVDITADGVVVEYALERREATRDEIEKLPTDKHLPLDSVSRFYALSDELKLFNDPFMMDISSNFPMMGNFYGKITVENNTATVDIF